MTTCIAPVIRPGTRAVVLGAGVSGVAAARLVCARGGWARVLDEGSAPAAAREALGACGAVYRGGDGRFPDDPCDLCVASPAFAADHPWLAACAARGIPVMAELELGARHWPGRILAVTGSKGKSSLVKLCADTLCAAGVSAAPGGNYGTPLCALALDAPGLAWAVVEVSSFQLEWVGTFAPDVAVLLNVQPDHLDRHGSFDAYRRLKERLFRLQPPQGIALLPAGYETRHGPVATPARTMTFGADPSADWRYDGHAVRATVGPFARQVSLAGSWFDNPVLGLAAAAGCAALAACGLGAPETEAGLRAFAPLPHRMQTVLEHAGIRYVDDSKATSLAALAAALTMAGTPVRLIAGGRLKESDLTGVKELLTRHTRRVYLIGESAHQMAEAWQDAAACEICETMDRAVARAAGEAMPGETVLLSPGTASFDQFKNYHERGERFAQAARQVTVCAARLADR
jgi:UDP-N-acetylmuramoylalanine--D-glutamate ligase